MKGERDEPEKKKDSASSTDPRAEGKRPQTAKVAKLEKPSGPDAWDRAATWLVEQGPLPALAIITIAIAVIHARIFLGETAGDDLSFHFAESARLADCIGGGDFDFWNPSANGGYASLYYYQAVPQLASAVPAAFFGHHLFWFQLSVVLPLIAAPACAYKGLRLLGATPWQSVAGAFCVAFMNGESRWGAGNAGTFQVGLYTQTWALCAFPLALGYAVRWMRDGVQLASATVWSGFVLLCHPFAGIALGIAVLGGWLANVIMLGVDPMLHVLAAPLKGKKPWLDRFVSRWEHPPERRIGGELLRGGVLAVMFGLVSLSVTLPVLIDADGFGGFPHRVSDEVGPGFKGLWNWYSSKAHSILDFQPKGGGMRLPILTVLLPITMIVARGKLFRWLWMPGILFAVFLGLGPAMGKIGDDLIPPVRFLGAMQTVFAMGIGAGVVWIGTQIWNAADKRPDYAYSIRTFLAAVAAASIVLVAAPGQRALASRVRTLGDHPDNKRGELMAINAILAAQPQGRKQSGPGAENHWWNLLSYAYDRVPTTLQMGGGGLQASPNYDFLWTQRDYVKNAWIFDAPYLVFATARGKNMPIGETLGATANFEVRKLPSPGVVSPVHVTGVLPPGYSHKEAGHKKALEWIKGEQPMKSEVLAYDGFGGAGDVPHGRTIRSWHQDSPGDDADIVAELDVQAPTTFTVRESWHPRWHAYLDGEEIDVRRVTPDFPAVDVPAGKHTLEMRFERPWWAHAAWLAWPLTALAAWFVTRRLRRAARTPQPAA
jgi:hypothetical protein